MKSRYIALGVSFLLGLATITSGTVANAATSPTHLASQTAPSVNGAGLGALSTHTPSSINSCAQVRQNLTVLAAQGHATATCVAPSPTPGSDLAGLPGLAPAAVHPASITAPDWCNDTQWTGTRFEMCYIQSADILEVDTDTGETIGFAAFTVTDDIIFTEKTQFFDENFDFNISVVVGDFEGATVSMSVACGISSTCLALGGFTDAPIVEGEDVTTTLSYSDLTSSTDANFISYTLTSGPTTLVPVTWTSPPFRCDNVIPNYPAGCVVPGIPPVLTTMTQLPDIAANIFTVQLAGPHHYGLETDGNPLTRNSSLRAANHAAACPPPANPVPGYSCDEYPFASTDQGASQTQQPDWGTALVPNTEQNSQAGLITGFYNEYRVLNGTNGATGDAFWVDVSDS